MIHPTNDFEIPVTDGRKAGSIVGTFAHQQMGKSGKHFRPFDRRHSNLIGNLGSKALTLDARLRE